MAKLSDLNSLAASELIAIYATRGRIIKDEILNNEHIEELNLQDFIGEFTCGNNKHSTHYFVPLSLRFSDKEGFVDRGCVYCATIHNSVRIVHSYVYSKDMIQHFVSEQYCSRCFGYRLKRDDYNLYHFNCICEEDDSHSLYSPYDEELLLDFDPIAAREFDAGDNFVESKEIRVWRPNARDSYQKLFRWKCNICQDFYLASLGDRLFRKKIHSCPFCNGTYVSYDNSICSTNPKMARRYYKNNVIPAACRVGEDIRAYYQCEKCGIIRMTTAAEYEKDECPICAQKFSKDDVKRHFREIIIGSTDFIRKGIEDIYSNIQLQYRCELCGHIYNMSHKEFFFENKKCPYCNILNKSFIDVCPEAKLEWSYVNNFLLPEKILPSASNMAWFCCRECNKLYKLSTYKYMIYRQRKKISCPYCKGLRPKHIHFF